MKQFKAVCFILSLVFAGSAYAGHHEKADERYAYTTYFKCDITQQTQVDALMLSEFAPVYESMIKQGTLKGWGWLAHHTGGHWRRALYSVTDSLDSLLAAQKSLNDMINNNNGDSNNILAKACNSHVDYIWKFEDGKMDKKRGTASLSVYMECSLEGEERADEIVKSVFAPVFNAHVGKGKLSSWGWASHIFGGKYRRLSTMTAASFSDLLKTRAEIIQTLFADNGPAEALEFSQICYSHQDYLWDIQMEM